MKKMEEQGNWKPYNVKALVRNIGLVFKKKDIMKLNKPTYKFITLHMGFIAHYDLYGFQTNYENLRLFCRTLQTGELSNDLDANLHAANSYEADRTFRHWYGEAHVRSVAVAIRGIVEMVRRYSDETRKVFTERERLADLAEARRLVSKWADRTA